MTRQVGLKSLNDPIDTTTPQGRLIFNLFASLAEFEREVIRERTQAGLSAARARGRLGGRPKGLPRKAEVDGVRGRNPVSRRSVERPGHRRQAAHLQKHAVCLLARAWCANRDHSRPA